MPISTFLNGRAPTALRGLQMLGLSDTGNVLTRTYVSDSGGGSSQSWAAGPVVQCRIDPIGSRREGRITGGQIDERSTHVVTVPAGTTVTTDNRFQMTGRGTFEITATRDRTAAWSVVFEVVALA